MKRWGLVLGLVLMACSPSEPQQDANATAEVPAITTGCTANESRDWSAVGSQYYVIEAEGSGETCQSATATLRIKSQEGAVLFERSYPTAQVPLAFNPNATQTGFREELEAWVSNTAETPTADWLPAWPSHATHPPGFTPAVSRNVYENARGAQGPLFCYPDGAESNACVALAGDQATLLGSLTPEHDRDAG